MPKFIKYRGAAKVPGSVVRTYMKGTVKMVKFMPRKDWINPGEKVPVTRRASNVHSQKSSIPRRNKK